MASIVIGLVIAAIAAGKAKAAPATHNDPRPCVQLEIPIKLSGFTTTQWLQPRVDSSIDAVDWVDVSSTWSTTTNRTLGKIVVNDTFKINGQLCVPPKGVKSDILQVATHGIGFDKRSVRRL